ncbi:unnamed protein product [Caenorhabditis bovis]|uniref:NDT80 domain-containing protein n=1 Tax=Caenorhabditis bovis TaxID=2654633 RepID=A0A8S1E7U5_9PELO|nr:unnamed protein product [Caenorhabditis bovis]
MELPHVPKEEPINDPLANVEQFNILQFLQPENDNNRYAPLEDPLLNVDDMGHPLNEMIDSPQNHALFQQIAASGIPESPPITDHSGNVSSGGQPINHHNLGLSVNDLQGILRQDYQNENFGVNKQEPSTSDAGFMSPYPPPPPQMTPMPNMTPSPEYTSRNENFTISQYPNSHISSLYTGVETDPNAIDHPNRKRARFEESAKLYAALQGNGNGDNGEAVTQQAIRFSKYQEECWNLLFDEHGRQLSRLQIHVVADKGFNYSQNDGCFVNQKKNHFQISVHLEALDANPPKKVIFNGALYPIQEFKLAFVGVKTEMPTTEITVRQSRADRKPHPHNPVLFDIQERRVTKVTVPRLHFSETTQNNQRKNFRPNPEQKYFYLFNHTLRSVSSLG